MGFNLISGNTDRYRVMTCRTPAFHSQEGHGLHWSGYNFRTWESGRIHRSPTYPPWSRITRPLLGLNAAEKYIGVEVVTLGNTSPLLPALTFS